MTAIAAIIGGVGALAATGAQLYGQSQQAGRAGAAAGIAGQQQAMQAALQAEMMRQQREMQTATQTDAYGNKVYYDPQRGWIVAPSQAGFEDIGRDRAAASSQAVDYFGRGRLERDSNFARRTKEGAAASPLLDAIAQRYGAPTMEGVIGANKVAGATAASENADMAKSAYNAAALRTGSGSVPLQHTLASADRGAASGVRTALADAEATGRTSYNQQFSDWITSMLNPYDKLASRASNTENAPVPSSNVQSNLDTSLLQRSVRGVPNTNPYAGLGPQQQATNALISAMGNQQQPAWGSAIGGITDNLVKIFENYGKSEKPTITRNSSTQEYF